MTSAWVTSVTIGVSRQEAQDFIDAYFAGFPSVREFIDRTLDEARRTGVVKTMYGRRRLVPDLVSRNGQLGKVAGGRARMILTVHDELLFEAPREAADETAAAVRELMEGAVQLSVPLTVDVGIGENWKDAKS